MASRDGPSFSGNNTLGANLNQGPIHADGDINLGNVNNLGNKDGAKPYEECLKRLFRAIPDDPVDYKDSLVTRNGRRTPGTCGWLLSTTQYTKWASGSAELLWITGDAGKGKTMLSLFLIEHHEAIISQQAESQKLI
ncbi:hypothetical protein BDV96DRAFT_650939 [Lophiotrema nucula]|uniref:Nephrocystin 3-like N-terminal domain-containing protein n=1 Tax=Lophiotrema nucula TaxID=690887 RepID=A0A6A5YT40_9PLEO|nr:hypothetical protein BDV96DRAFT_650939 [Lophiotrema nucula]